jgi:hypothetical protein
MTNKQQKAESVNYARSFKGLDDRSPKKELFIVFSLKNFDSNQGQSYQNWEKDSLLSLALKKIQHICNLTVNEAKNQQIIKCYTKVDFPPKTGFYHPQHIPKRCNLVFSTYSRKRMLNRIL